jgi:hypothetical protein
MPRILAQGNCSVKPFLVLQKAPSYVMIQAMNNGARTALQTARPRNTAMSKRPANEQAAFDHGKAVRKSGHHMAPDENWTRAEYLAAMRGFGCYPDQIAREKAKGPPDERIGF